MPAAWIGFLPSDKSPRGNLEMREEAENYLDHLCSMAESQVGDEVNEAGQVALVDAYNRCIEGRRRAQHLLKLHEKWSKRRIGGVVEPEG